MKAVEPRECGQHLSHEDVEEQRHLRQREQQVQGPKKGTCLACLRKEDHELQRRERTWRQKDVWPEKQKNRKTEEEEDYNADENNAAADEDTVLGA